MPYITGSARHQTLLLPERLEDYIGPEHEVRAIDEFVAGLDLMELGIHEHDFGVAGRPPYDPRDLLKLYVWGYLNRIRSSRRLELACTNNLEVIWLLRQLRPDYKTISEFRRIHRSVFPRLLQEFNQVCRELELFGAELVAIDGALFPAVNSKQRNYTAEKVAELSRRVEERIAQWLEQLDGADPAEEGAGGAKSSAAALSAKLEKLRQRRAELQQLAAQVNADGQVSLTDPDSRLMRKSGGAVVGYNVQLAVDGQHKLIVDIEPTPAGNDRQQLAPAAQRAQAALGVSQLQVVADSGYFGLQSLRACEAAGITATVAVRATAAAGTGRYGKEQFRYEAAADRYVCPAGQPLARQADVSPRGQQTYQTYQNAAACRVCARRAECTRSDRRVIKRLPDEEAIERMRQRAQEHPERMRWRAATIEHVLGTLKAVSGRLLLRGREKVRAELTLTACAYNLRRVLNLIGSTALREQLRVRGAAA